MCICAYVNICKITICTHSMYIKISGNTNKMWLIDDIYHELEMVRKAYFKFILPSLFACINISLIFFLTG